jgi:hypothetical protein
VKLITKAVAELKSSPTIGRAEALRRATLSMIDTGKSYEAHPAFRAPFVITARAERHDDWDVACCWHDLAKRASTRALRRVLAVQKTRRSSMAIGKKYFLEVK